ncbi:MAG TPA: hypothetical protein ENK57_24970, partial [Polyangiaceae bacterium]|nr:hypothetical protein [Polyangiaceae bacterium]
MTESARDDGSFKPTDTLPSVDELADESGDAPVTPETDAVPNDSVVDGEHAPGDVVAERYEILEVLGRGVSGTVYRARDLYVDSGHEIVALKAIHAHLHTDRQ